MATLSCPCELTGHKYCDHSQHIVLKNRKDIRKWRTQGTVLENTNTQIDSLTQNVDPSIETGHLMNK